LALDCSFDGRVDGVVLWWMLVLWSTHREWLLLRYVLGEQVMIIGVFFPLKKALIFIINCIIDRQVSSNDFEELEKVMKRGANEKQPFERLEISKEDLLRLFGVNKIIYYSINYGT